MGRFAWFRSHGQRGCLLSRILTSVRRFTTSTSIFIVAPTSNIFSQICYALSWRAQVAGSFKTLVFDSRLNCLTQFALQSNMQCTLWYNLSIRRFWGKGGRREAKKGESERRETPFLSLLPLPLPLLTSLPLLSPSPLGRSDTQVTYDI